MQALDLYIHNGIRADGNAIVPPDIVGEALFVLLFDRQKAIQHRFIVTVKG